jgi:hypothetical protein
MLIEQLFANSSTTTISFGDGADNAVDITAAANVAAGATGPIEMVQSATNRWQVGANDIGKLEQMILNFMVSLLLTLQLLVKLECL